MLVQAKPTATAGQEHACPQVKAERNSRQSLPCKTTGVFTGDETTTHTRHHSLDATRHHSTRGSGKEVFKSVIGRACTLRVSGLHTRVSPNDSQRWYSGSPRVSTLLTKPMKLLEITSIESGRVWRCLKSYESGWVGSGRVGSGRYGSGGFHI